MDRTVLRRSCLLLAGGVVALIGAAAGESKSLTADQILSHMAEAYANCGSYQDSGVVKTVFFPNGQRHYTVEKPFTTAFSRPDRFRFEYRDRTGDGPEDYRRYIVSRQGEDVQTWWDIRPGIERPKSLALALAGATGVSGGSAYTIPALLLPNEIGRSLLTQLTETKRLEDAELDGVECFRVEGRIISGPMTVWIDNATFLVRRIDSQSHFPDFRTEETTTYTPVIDSEIAEPLLEFNPPVAEVRETAGAAPR